MFGDYIRIDLYLMLAVIINLRIYMKDIKIDYAQLLETNNLIQQNADETYWLCATRTVQESKIFPVSAYILFSYLNCFYRFPELLKKIEAVMPAEEVGDRARIQGLKIVAWTIPCFYLLVEKP